jgi:hypothetical protein
MTKNARGIHSSFVIGISFGILVSSFVIVPGASN